MQTTWRGLKKQEFSAVRCVAVVGDTKNDDSVVALQEKKLTSAQAKSYPEAQKAKMELKAHFEATNKKKKGDLEKHYKEEFENFDMDQLGLFANFNADKERTMQEYDAKAKESLGKFQESQSEAHSKYMEKLKAETLPTKPRWSPELLRMWRVEGILSNQTEYTQANMRKTKAAELEKIESQGWEAVRNKKIKVLEDQFVQKQKEALANAIKKIAARRDELDTKHKREIERMHSYKNGHEKKLMLNRKSAMSLSSNEIGRVSYARQLCGTATSAGLRP